MPWHVETDHADCAGGWAVVKNDGGALEGCHQSEGDALEQIAALYAEEAETPQDVEAEFAADTYAGQAEVPAHGVLLVEGVATGDSPRREFAPGSSTWAELPLPLKWQEAEGERHSGAVVVGRMDRIWRDGDVIRWVGAVDNVGDAGREVVRQRQANFVRTVSIMADDYEPDDVEYVYQAPDDDMDDDDEDGAEFAADDSTFHAPGKHNQREHAKKKGGRKKGTGWKGNPKFPVNRSFGDGDEPEPANPPEGMDLGLLMADPVKTIFHKGRIRSATVVAEPAFVEAVFDLGPSPHTPPVEPMVAAAVAAHDTATSDAPWDGPAAEKRLPSPMPEATGRGFYAWIDDSQVTDGQMPKEAGRFGHHEVSDDGTPGAANIRACQTGIGVLNGGRGGTTIPEADVQGVYDHLAAHLRDAGLEPPELMAVEAAVVAAGWSVTIPEVWPEWWFDQPKEQPPFGALHITPQGRVYGYLGPANVTHRAFRGTGRTVTIPRNIDYSEFQNKQCIVAGADGHVYRINAGNITFDCGHANPYDPRRSDPSWAVQHYDNSCSIAARIRVGEDDRGTWVAGGLLHGISADALERMMGCALSGDWQGGKLKAALLVPSEGFPVAAAARVRVREDALVATSVPIVYDHPEPDVDDEDVDDIFDLVASAIGMDDESRWQQALVDAGRGEV